MSLQIQRFSRVLRLVSIKSSCRCAIIIPAPASTCPTPRLYNSSTFVKLNLKSARNFSDTTMDRVVTYEDVVTYKDKPEVLLVDVRDPNELAELGQIPSSVNIPLGELNTTLQNQNSEEFKKKHGRDFPKKDTEIVFYCKMGGRATKAMDAALANGYVNSKVYKGSYTDWTNKTQGK